MERAPGDRVSKTVPEPGACVSATGEVRRCGHGVDDTVFAFRPHGSPADRLNGICLPLEVPSVIEYIIIMEFMEFALMSAGALFAIINPLAAIPTFFAMTPSNTEAERLKMARTASVTASGVLILFALTGNRLFGIFGITIAAFQMAGGLILLLVSLDSLRAKRSEVQETEEEKQEGIEKDDISITPLAIPMLSGPGAITTAILLQSKAKTVIQDATLYLLFVLMGFVCYFTFRFSIKKAKKINPIAMNITTRLMGLMLAATAMQFMLDGIKKTFFAAN